MSDRDEESKYAIAICPKTGVRFVGVMLDSNSGSFFFSREAELMYRMEKGLSAGGFGIERTDPVMISVVRRLGSACASAEPSCITLRWVPWPCRNCFEVIEQVEGPELLRVSMDGYRLEQVRRIVGAAREDTHVAVADLLDRVCDAIENHDHDSAWEHGVETSELLHPD
jgi:hypothetical protein